MPRALRLALAVMLLGGAVAMRAEERSQTSPNPPPVAAPARAISPRIAEVLRATLPSYDDAVRQQTAPPKAPPNPIVALETDPGVASLPTYVVNEGRLPTAAQVMSRRAIEEVAMNRYLGPKDGLDRGLLNAVTLKQLWQKIPVLGKLPLPIPNVSNEERAMQRYYDDLRVEQKKDLMELSTLTAKSGDPAQAERIKRETQKAFKNE